MFAGEYLRRNQSWGGGGEYFQGREEILLLATELRPFAFPLYVGLSEAYCGLMRFLKGAFVRQGFHSFAGKGPDAQGCSRDHSCFHFEVAWMR